jgi:DUF4097 and DUF4098 domain-containing protein YvlB
MKNTVIEKLDMLEESGKITHEQRMQLEEKWNHRKDNSSPFSSKEEAATETCNDNQVDIDENQNVIPVDLQKELVCKSIDEDIEIIGDPQLKNIEIKQGRDLVDIVATEKRISIKSKKDVAQRSFFVGRKKRRIQLLVPSKLEISLKSVSGDLQLHNLQQSIVAKSVSGDIQTNELHGMVELETISGDIEINSTTHLCKAFTKSGDIEISNSAIQGPIKCFSGDIGIVSATISDAEIGTFSGDVALNKVSPQGTVYLKTHSGDLHAHLLTNGGTIATKDTNKPKKFIDYMGQEQPFTEQPVSFGNGTDVELLIKTKSGDENIRLEEN